MEDTIYTVNLVDATSGAVNIANSNGVNIATSLVAAQFEDADGTPTPTPSLSAAELSLAAAPPAGPAGTLAVATAASSSVVDSVPNAASDAPTAGAAKDVSGDVAAPMGSIPSPPAASSGSISKSPASDFQLPPSLVGFCPKLTINEPKSFVLSEANSPVDFSVSLQEHQGEVEAMEKCLAKADTFDVLKVRFVPQVGFYASP